MEKQSKSTPHNVINYILEKEYGKELKAFMCIGGAADQESDGIRVRAILLSEGRKSDIVMAIVTAMQDDTETAAQILSAASIFMDEREKDGKDEV